MSGGKFNFSRLVNSSGAVRDSWINEWHAAVVSAPNSWGRDSVSGCLFEVDCGQAHRLQCLVLCIRVGAFESAFQCLIVASCLIYCLFTA